MSPPVTSRADIELATWSHLKGASWTVFQRMRASHGDDDVTPAQMAFLNVLLEADDGPLTPRDLAARIEVTPATVTGALNPLEAAGLIERVRQSSDRRVIHVLVTAAGKAQVEAWRAAHRAQIKAAFRDLSVAEMARLNALLRRIGEPIHGPPGGFARLARSDFTPRRNRRAPRPQGD